MIALIPLIVVCTVVISVGAWLTVDSARKSSGAAQNGFHPVSSSPPVPAEDAVIWTSLDDLQLTRLLDDAWRSEGEDRG